MHHQYLNMEVNAVKHAIRQQKHFTFTALCVALPLALSVCHTWLSNNPVVGQTQLYPEDISLYMALFSCHFLFPNFPLFVLSLYYIYTTFQFRVSYMALVTSLPPFLSVHSVIFYSVA